MTVKEFLATGDKRKKIYRDVKEYVDIIKHHKGNDAVNEVLNKQVVDVIGIDI